MGADESVHDRLRHKRKALTERSARALSQAREQGVWMYKCDTIADIKADIDDTMEKSIEITADMLKTNLFARFVRAVVRIFAPML